MFSEKLTPQIGGRNFEKHPLHSVLWGLSILGKISGKIFFFNVFNGERKINNLNSWGDLYFTPHFLDSFLFGLLPLLLEMLGNMCTVIICLPTSDVMNFEINLSFLTKPFSYMTKKSG